MSDDDLFFSLRRRAFDLAQTGRYRHWDQVAAALHREGAVGSVIARLDRDGGAVMMITRCCEQARAKP